MSCMASCAARWQHGKLCALEKADAVGRSLEIYLTIVLHLQAGRISWQLHERTLEI